VVRNAVEEDIPLHREAIFGAQNSHLAAKTYDMFTAAPRESAHAPEYDRAHEQHKNPKRDKRSAQPDAAWLRAIQRISACQSGADRLANNPAAVTQPSATR
jgi:hypothetical protein